MSFGCTIIYDGKEITTGNSNKPHVIQHQLLGLAPYGMGTSREPFDTSDLRDAIMTLDWEFFCERLRDNLHSISKEHDDCPSCQCSINPTWDKEKVIWLLSLDPSKIKIKDAGY